MLRIAAAIEPPGEAWQRDKLASSIGAVGYLGQQTYRNRVGLWSDVLIAAGFASEAKVRARPRNVAWHPASRCNYSVTQPPTSADDGDCACAVRRLGSGSRTHIDHRRVDERDLKSLAQLANNDGTRPPRHRVHRDRQELDGSNQPDVDALRPVPRAPVVLEEHLRGVADDDRDRVVASRGEQVFEERRAKRAAHDQGAGATGPVHERGDLRPRGSQRKERRQCDRAIRLVDHEVGGSPRSQAGKALILDGGQAHEFHRPAGESHDLVDVLVDDGAGRQHDAIGDVR